MFEKTNLVSKIFYINIIAFIFTLAIPNLMFLFAAYPINSNEFSVYRFISYMFIHSGFTHLIFNMIGLLSFGPLCENDLGEKKFLWLYFISGVFGAFIQLLFFNVPLVGASAAIFALMVYYALRYPNAELSIIFLPFFSFKAKKLIAFFVIIEIFSIIFGVQDGVGHIAHLGGAFIGLCGFFMNKSYENRKNFR
jgi:membrane associated rhomboid family serine protease